MKIVWYRSMKKLENGPIDLAVEDSGDQKVILKGTDLQSNLLTSEIVINEMEKAPFDTLLELVYDWSAKPDYYESKSIFQEVLP
ncbi:MAG: hypothetical protein HDR44_00885 [Allobaculum sp.]|nr:hypothetical protein [Allobaculum sp.]